MIHGFFYGVLFVGFLIGMAVEWYYRAYFDLLIMVHCIEMLFIGVLGWYSFGPLVLLPLAGLWLSGMGAIYVMNRFA